MLIMGKMLKTVIFVTSNLLNCLFQNLFGEFLNNIYIILSKKSLKCNMVVCEKCNKKKICDICLLKARKMEVS